MKKRVTFTFWIISVLLCVVTLVSFQGGIGFAEAKEIRVIALTSRTSDIQQKVQDGFVEAIRRAGLGLHLESYSLETDETSANTVIQRLKQDGADLILALGSKPTTWASEEILNIPIVTGFSMGMESLDKPTNVTGVALEIPVAVQLQWMKRMLPALRDIGVIYSPKENQQRIESASKVAPDLGIRLHAEKIEDPKDIPAALRNVLNRTEALWGIADSMVLNAQTGKQILLTSFRSQIPFIGPSEPWAKAGALYALDRDYFDLGQQAGEIALRILKGEKPQKIPLEPPRRILYYVNRKTAEHMRIEIPENVLKAASAVY